MSIAKCALDPDRNGMAKSHIVANWRTVMQTPCLMARKSDGICFFLNVRPLEGKIATFSSTKRRPVSLAALE
jgi:hypothetical protein